MGDFGAFLGRRGVVGFNGCCSGVRCGDGGFMLACISGRRSVIGFNIATLPRPAREKVRPAGPERGREREKVRPAREKQPKIGGLWRAGRVFSRKCRCRDRAGRTFSRVSTRGPVAGRISLCHRCSWRALQLHVGRSRRRHPATAAWPRPVARSELQTKRPPTHHARAGDTAKTAWSPSAARNVWKVRSHKQRKQHYGRKQLKRRVLTSSRASRGRRSSRAAGIRRAGRGGSPPRARGAR